MLSPIVGPSCGTQDAVADLKQLLASPAIYDEWLSQPITRMVLAAIEQHARGRTPQPNLPVTDYAQAVGEVAGMQRAVIVIRDPEAFLGALGLGKGPVAVALPPPSYTAPEPPPAN